MKLTKGELITLRLALTSWKTRCTNQLIILEGSSDLELINHYKYQHDSTMSLAHRVEGELK